MANFILICLTVALSIGAIVSLAWGVVTCVREREGLAFVIGALGVLISAPLAVLCEAIRRDMHSPTFTLRKDDWTCTRSHLRTTTSVIMAGKTPVPTTTKTRVCDVYTRR